MINSLKRTLLVLVVINAWCLFGILILDYLLGNILGLFATSIYTQAWGVLLLIGLSFSSALKITQLKIKQWFSTTLLGMYLAEPLRECWTIACRALRALYINLYLLADVVFCVGAPLLVIIASAGWWLIDDISYIALLGYCCMICIIVLAGLYSNLARLLSLGYFFGCWLLTDNMLLYPFAAPGLVDKNISIMLNQSLGSWLPAIGLVLIVYLLASRPMPMPAEADVAADQKPDKGQSKTLLQSFLQIRPESFSRELFGNYMSLFCLLMAVPLAFWELNSIIAYLNPHVLFAGFTIWILDQHWQSDVANEPALSSDFRYFVNLIWKP